MGICCCKDNSRPYFVLEGSRMTRHSKYKNRKRNTVPTSLYHQYSKKKCYICNKIKLGRSREVVYGNEFICIECFLNVKPKENKFRGRY